MMQTPPIPESLKMWLETYPQSPTPWLMYGIGNVGRNDDGLGIRWIEEMERLATAPPSRILNPPIESNSSCLLKNLSFQSNYQLNIEDALEITKYDLVIFADASKESMTTPFQLVEVFPNNEISFSTHAMTIENLLALCEALYGKRPLAYLLKIQGYSWEIQDHLSIEGEKTLAKTLDALAPLFRQ